MKKVLVVTLLCSACYVHADLYTDIEQAIVNSDVATTRTLLEAPLLPHEYDNLLYLATETAEQRLTEYTHNHYRPFLSSGKIAMAWALNECRLEFWRAATQEAANKAYAEFKKIDYSPDLKNLTCGAITLIGGAFLLIQLCRSFLSQTTDLQNLYNDALMIKYLIASKKNQPPAPLPAY